MNRCIHLSPRRQAGVTLVELMVSLVLAMLIVAGIMKVFAGNRVTYEFNQSLSRVQENARFVLDHLAFNTRMGGYSGCISDAPIYNNLNGPSSFRDDLANGIYGLDANGTGSGETWVATATNPAASPNEADWTPSLPTELDGRVIPGSDVLVIRGISGVGIQLVAPFHSHAAASFFVATPHDFLEGEILVVSDCQKASIFQLTNLNDDGQTVVHSNDNTYVPGNDGPVWGEDQEYGIGAEVGRLEARAFYVGVGENGVPALYQLRLALTAGPTTSGFVAEELVEGIESMQVRFGLDTGNDAAIDSWVDADAVADWMEVLGVEVTLLARAPEEYGTEVDEAVYTLGATSFNPVDDRRLRQVFSTTIGVRNRLP